MPHPGRLSAIRRPGPAPAEGAGILGPHPAAETLLAALRVQVRTGRLVRSGQLPLESPCPGWSEQDTPLRPGLGRGLGAAPRRQQEANWAQPEAQPRVS